jgi:hypothetical protein
MGASMQTGRQTLTDAKTVGAKGVLRVRGRAESKRRERVKCIFGGRGVDR